MQIKPLKFGEKEKKTFHKLLPFFIVIGILLAISFFLIFRGGAKSSINYVSQILAKTSLKSTDDRVNILLLGIAGGAHDGTNLTDTIMVASYDLNTNKVYLFSLPRDLWVPELKSKVNAVYQTGLSKNDGLGYSKTIIGNILGLPIHYGLRVDFRGFVQAIDAIDGIDIVIDKPFDDYLYPIQGKENDMCGNEEKEMEFNEEEAKKLNIEPGKRKVLILADGQIATDSADEKKGMKYYACRYEHIAFETGEMKMSGAVALSFVRSRHGTNGEGSDFARSKRQQKVIDAVRHKILSLDTLSSPQKIMELTQALGKSVDTDITIKEAVDFYKLSKKIEATYNFVLDDSARTDLPDGKKSIFIHPSASDYGGAYVLISQDDDFSTVQNYVRKVLSGEVTEYEATTAARAR